MGEGAALTSDYEKTVIDVITTSLSRMDRGQKFAILTGVLVMLCEENGIAPQILHELLDARFAEYRGTFDAA